MYHLTAMTDTITATNGIELEVNDSLFAGSKPAPRTILLHKVLVVQA